MPPLSQKSPLIVFLIALAAAFPLRSQSTIQITSAITTRLPVPGDFCTAPPLETSFLTTDTRVWVVYAYTGGSAGDIGYTEWFDPNGNLYTTSTLQQTSTGGSHCSGAYIGIYGYTPASEPGTWRVRLRWGTTEVFSRNFTIAAPAASSISLVSNTTLPQAIVGAPYSFTFQASGGTAPYKYSLSTGTTPPGLSLSSAGVLSGTATSAASYVMGLHIADSAGNTLDRDIALAVSLPTLQIGVGSLAFSYTQNGTLPAPQTFSLSSNGSALPFTVSKDQTWLAVSPSSGTTPGTITVSIQPQGLAAGSYQGNLTVQSNGATLPTQIIPVSLAVLPSGAGTLGGIIRTAAGTDWTFTVPNRQAKNAPLGQVYGMVFDSSGNLYAADYNNNLIVKIAPDGTTTVVAGNGFDGFSGDGGPAVNASLSGPGSVAVDASGNVYIADTFNLRVRRVTPDGIINTIAGTGSFGFAGDNGPALSALLGLPSSIAVDSSGNVFFFDFGNARIRKVSPGGTITTVAGNGKTGYTTDGAATSVPVEVINQMAFDSYGNLYFGDDSYHVRKLTPSGTTVLVAGNGQPCLRNSATPVPPCGDGGQAATAQLLAPDGLAIDSSGRIYIADFNIGRIRVIDPSGVISTFAGVGSDLSTSGDNGPALKAGMNPIALAVASGALYLADFGTTTIRKIDTSSIISTFAGNDGYRSAADGTPAGYAFFNDPQGLAFDHFGNLYIADSAAARIRKVSPAGVFSTIGGFGAPGIGGDNGPATQAYLSEPTSIAVDTQNNIYFADSGNHRIRRIGAADGKITTVAGDSNYSFPGFFGGDGGPATQASLSGPQGLAIDASGNLFIADTGNNVIRRVNPLGVISTYAGTPPTCTSTSCQQHSGYSGDNGPASRAALNAPYGVVVDSSGNLYIADSGNHVVRFVSAAGLISTFAGNGKSGFSGDGGQARNASLNAPQGLALDSSGNLYILENGGNRIRQVTPAGVITTIAGTGRAGFSGDGGPSPAAQLNGPTGSMAYQNGAIYFTDTGNERVRSITLGGTATSAPSISASTSTLSFTAVSSGPATNTQSVTLRSSSAGLPLQIATSTTTGGAWLQVDVTSANCPATINVSANPASLAAGTYQGTVTISAPYASPSQVSISVTLTVTAATSGHLTIGSAVAGSSNSTPAPLSFQVQSGASPVSSQISLSNSGSGSLSFTAASSTAAGGSWLSVTPANGSVSASAPVALTIAINPGSLNAAVYSGTITLSSPDNADPPLVIPVTLLVSNPVPVILISQTGMTFQAAQGGGNPLPQTFDILNVGQGVMNWTATAQALSGGNWLSVSPASGTVSTPFVSFSTVSVGVNASSLAPGNYFGQIQVRAPGATNAPQSLAVVLNVLAPGTPLSPEVRPSGLVFIGSASNPPGSQTVSIANRGTSTFTFNSSKLTSSNINWITNAPVAGSIGVNSPGAMTVQPDLSQRSPGVDRGVITVLFDDGSAQTISLLSVVPPPGYLPSDEPRQIRDAALSPHASGSCTANQLVGQLTNPGTTNAQSPLGQPVSLELYLKDDCGNPVTDKYPASINVAFSTKEPALTMQHTSNGKWTRTWQPASTQPASVAIEFVAFATGTNGKLLATQIPLSINLTSAAQVPLVSPGGIQNAASYSSAPVVSPGGLIAIFGNQLSDAGGQLAPPGPWPTSLGHTQVKLGDSVLPLLFTTNDQLNAQVPFSLPLNSQQQLVVTYENSLSVPAAVSVSAAQPAIFTQNQAGTGQGAIVNGVTNVLADSKNPVHAGDVISIYCTGLGPVSPPQPEGAIASTAFTSQTVTAVTATIGGVPATVQFAGLAPGYIGLYQVNVQVPTGVTPGDTVPVILTEGSQVSPPVTISVR